MVGGYPQITQHGLAASNQKAPKVRTKVVRGKSRLVGTQLLDRFGLSSEVDRRRNSHRMKIAVRRRSASR